ncbi:hypothetical protein M758_12G129300 [Ceratodon purpureus]|nr:hypothetical protein M758_12G129300 [Ceratodon purpureus]
MCLKLAHAQLLFSGAILILVQPLSGDAFKVSSSKCAQYMKNDSLDGWFGDVVQDWDRRYQKRGRHGIGTPMGAETAGQG